ncbi:MAG: DNA-formamidopyrimidine glycosylase family protein [Pseudomonadota bacterium]
MPELPDITVYIDALNERVAGQRLEDIRITNPFLLRSVQPPIESAQDQVIKTIRRFGKRIGFELSNDIWVVVHLMIAGRLQWDEKRTKKPTKNTLAILSFGTGALHLTEAGSKKRASLHLYDNEAALTDTLPQGIDIETMDLARFSQRLTQSNHTLKRALTDPHLFSGIGNAYSDEILHAARLSPILQTQKMDDEQIQTLFHCVKDTLTLWTTRLSEERGKSFPKKVTAFRPQMATHGKYGQPCPVCETTIQRIRYAENEVNYCPRCQTDGKVLADRGLSRLLKKDWPRTIDELERKKSQRAGE